MSNLRQEIIEAEKTRADFQKWKLIAVAALGAVGLGLSQTPSAGRAIPAYLVLPLIPLICLYADLLCRHLTLRILVTAAYLRLSPNTEQVYEQFVRKEARSETMNFFAFEDMALEWSTIFLSALVTFVGIFPRLLISEKASRAVFHLFATASGAVAILFSIWLRCHYKGLRQKLDNLRPADLPGSGRIILPPG
jgi:hypothetical protein